MMTPPGILSGALALSSITCWAAGLTKPMVVVMPNGKIDVPGFYFLSEEDRKSPAAVQRRIETIARMHDTLSPIC